MDLNHIILTLLLLTPLVGAVVLALLPERDGARTHHIGALLITLLTLVMTLHLPAHFQSGVGGFQFQQNAEWVRSPALR